MDKTADPCVDFFRYACGNWTKLNPMPPDQDSWNVYRKLSDDNERFLWGLLDQASRPDHQRTPNEQRIGDYFAACMNEQAVNDLGDKPLARRLESIGGLQSVNDIAGYVGEQHAEGIDREVLFNFSSGQDYENSTRVIAFAAAAG
ncbi:MAG: M13 family peptidase, partial [Acidobacteriaceae bacterium]|nr:M13 family peptidase [Acidobacteriaceae bacterium]